MLHFHGIFSANILLMFIKEYYITNEMLQFPDVLFLLQVTIV